MSDSDQIFVAGPVSDEIRTFRLCGFLCGLPAAGIVSNFRPAVGPVPIARAIGWGSVVATDGLPTCTTVPPVALGIASQYSLIALPAGAPQAPSERWRAVSASAGDAASSATTE